MLNVYESGSELYTLDINGHYLGNFGKDIDGYYYFWPHEWKGGVTSNIMMQIAEKLDELNNNNDEDHIDPERICPWCGQDSCDCDML